jgi:hypothetical protein
VAVTVFDARKAAAEALDDLQAYSAGSGTASSVSIANLISQAAAVSPNAYNGRWVLNASKQAQARVRNGGYTATSGMLMVDPAWTVPSNGDQIELTALFPGIAPVFVAETSYLTLIQRACRRLVYPDRISLPIVVNQTTYSLAQWGAWLDRPERLGWGEQGWRTEGSPDELERGAPPIVYEPGPFGSTLIPADWRRPRLRLDAAQPFLELDEPFRDGASGVLTINVRRPVWSLVNGQESTTGPAADADQLLCERHDLVACILLEAFAVLERRSANAPSGRGGAERYALQIQVVHGLRWFDASLERTLSPAQGRQAGGRQAEVSGPAGQQTSPGR